MKTCVCINLSAAEDRRRSIEASFTAAEAGEWSLRRFEALGPAAVTDVPGSLKPTEKACFVSHRAALGEHLAGDDPVLIVEDDAVFSPQAFGVLDGLLTHGGDWDLLFTDAALCDFNLMVHLAARRDGMAARGEYLPVDLKGRSYFGSVFPFVTSLSPQADGSQIQGGDTAVFDQTLNAYRRLMYVARDLDQCRADAEHLAAHADEAARLVGGVFAAIVSPAFPLDR